MSRKALLIIVGAALFFIIAIISLYTSTFGITRSPDQSLWGSFGDYFGGILNPVFALCAFLGVLCSLDIQIKQFKQISLDKQGEEILSVVKDIDVRIGELIRTQVSKPGHDPILLMHHMVAESERGVGALGSSDAYIKFIAVAKESGTVLEAATRELRAQIIAMHSFLNRHPQSRNGFYAPIVEYYIQKTSRVVKMLNEVEEFPPTVYSFFSHTQ